MTPLALVSAGLAIAIWVPALGIPLGPLLIQPIELVVGAGALLLPFYARHVARPTTLLIAALFYVAVLASFYRLGVSIVLLYHALVIAPFFLIATVVMSLDRERERFFNWFTAAGTVSVVLFLAQYFLDAASLDFRNNTNFSLPRQYDRGFALFPEISIFAIHTIILAAMMLVRVAAPGEAEGRAPKLYWFILGLAVFALFLSRSTAMLVVFPVVAGFAVFRYRRFSPIQTLWILLAFAAGTLIVIAFIQFSYASRLENESGERSAAIRLVSILGAFYPIFDGEPLGVGIGNNDMVTEYAYRAVIDFGLVLGVLPVGVDSSIFQRVFEEGVLAVLQYAIAGVLFMRVLVMRFTSTTARTLQVVALGSAIGALVMGYRAILTSYVWMAASPVLFAMAADLRHRSPGSLRRSRD